MSVCLSEEESSAKGGSGVAGTRGSQPRLKEKLGKIKP